MQGKCQLLGKFYEGHLASFMYFCRYKIIHIFITTLKETYAAKKK
jgi:hypothetical protein